MKRTTITRLRHLLLPWTKPTLADLPLEERRRAKALMLGAGIHHCGGPIEIEHLHVCDEEDAGGGELP